MRELFSRGRGARETAWPGVHSAYEFVIPSYQWAQQRRDAADLRIQTLQTFTATVTLGAPILAAAVVKDIDLRSGWFIGAIVVFVLTLVVGVLGRARGQLTLLTPKILYDQWLSKADWEFKKDAIYFAGEHFEKNRAEIAQKNWFADGMTGLFLVEIALALTWVLTEM